MQASDWKLIHRLLAQTESTSLLESPPCGHGRPWVRSWSREVGIEVGIKIGIRFGIEIAGETESIDMWVGFRVSAGRKKLAGSVWTDWCGKVSWCEVILGVQNVVLGSTVAVVESSVVVESFCASCGCGGCWICLVHLWGWLLGYLWDCLVHCVCNDSCGEGYGWIWHMVSGPFTVGSEEIEVDWVFFIV